MSLTYEMKALLLHPNRDASRGKEWHILKINGYLCISIDICMRELTGFRSTSKT